MRKERGWRDLDVAVDQHYYWAVGSGKSKTRSSASAEIARVGDNYAVQGHSRALMLVPIESPYATSYQ